jgi:hypothetical protein
MPPHQFREQVIPVQGNECTSIIARCGAVTVGASKPDDCYRSQLHDRGSPSQRFARRPVSVCGSAHSNGASGDGRDEIKACKRLSLDEYARDGKDIIDRAIADAAVGDDLSGMCSRSIALRLSAGTYDTDNYVGLAQWRWAD